MFDVVIIGAGATGLTLAIELQRRGLDYRIVDVADGPFGGSRGKGIQPRSLEIFDMMGVVDEIMAESSLYQPLRLHLGPVKKTIKAFGTSDEPSEALPHPNLRMVAQWRTEQVLREHLHKLGGQVEYGIGLEALKQGKHEVSVGLTNGETVTARYVAGCDGGKSVTRKAIGLSLVGKTLDDKTMVVADFEMEGLDRSVWHVWPLHKGGPTAFAPLPYPDVWQLQASERIAKDGLEEGIARLLKKRPKRIIWQSRFQHQIRMVEHYRIGNVFLAGDSAHIHPPSGAQGLNTGVQDAFNLGWKLASAVRTGNDTILDSYEAERLPIAAEMLNLTSTLHLEESPERGDKTIQLSVGYRGSPLAPAASGREYMGLQAGDRMPDRRLADGRRFFEAMRKGAAVQVAMRNGLRILVRPDGYIAGIGELPVDQYHGHDVVKVKSAAPSFT